MSPRRNPTIGILKPGSTFADMIVRFGDYDTWFDRVLAPTGVRTRVSEPGASLPEPESADGWIITGARSSVLDGGPGVDRLLDWIRQVVEGEFPLLGVCYGHQAVAAALGGRIERHPWGWELGTVEIELTDAGAKDPIFDGFPQRFLVHTTHQDQVAEPPPEATLLATNDHSPFQAFAIASSCRTVQFHPEVDEPISREFVDRRRHLVGAVPRIERAPLGERVLVNFAARFVSRPADRKDSAGRSCG